MKSAVSRYTSGENLGTLGSELSELVYILVIDLAYLILTENANLLFSVGRTESGTLCIISIHSE